MKAQVDRSFLIAARPLLALLATLLLAGCVTGVRETNELPTRLPKGEGAVAVVIDSNTPFLTLRVAQPNDVFAAIAARNIPAGRSIRFIVVPAGHYAWARADMSRMFDYHTWVELNKDEDKKRFEFEVKAGKVNYPGDFVVRTEDSTYTVDGPGGMHFGYYGGNKYSIETKDRAAMLLGDLTASETAIVRDLGLVYTGPGEDKFPAYYLKLAGK